VGRGKGEKARRRRRRIGHREGCNWFRDMAFIGSLCKAKVVRVEGKGKLSVTEDRLLPREGLSGRPGRETGIRRE
jgi:hypothetical protein